MGRCDKRKLNVSVAKTKVMRCRRNGSLGDTDTVVNVESETGSVYDTWVWILRQEGSWRQKYHPAWEKEQNFTGL